MLATLAGRRQILIVNQDYVSGHDPASGRPLWKHPWPGSSHANANVSQVVPVPNDRLLLSKGYGVGAKLLQVSLAGNGPWQVAEVWSNSRVLRTKYCNVVVHGGHVYGLSDGILECVELASGRRVWKAGRYAQGQILGVDDLLIVQAESGEVALVEATPAGHRELGRFAAVGRQDVEQSQPVRPLSAGPQCRTGGVLRIGSRMRAQTYRIQFWPRHGRSTWRGSAIGQN